MPHGCDILKLGKNVGKFGRVRLEELAPRRDVEEEIPDLEVAPHGAGDRLLGDHLGALYLEFRPLLRILHAGLQGHMRHSSDGGERLASEAHGDDGEEVCRLADLARRMPLKGHPGIHSPHTGAVVDDLDQCLAGILDDDLDVGRTGIDGILDQLLDDRSRSLNHLTGSDLIGNIIR